MISIVVLTYNRLHLLQQCVENVIARTSPATREIVIWDNASDDGTREYLDSLDDPRLKIVHHPENIAMNAKARAVRLTTCDYILELDDDIIDAPSGWDETLLNAFVRLPEIGYLQASLVDDPNDSASQYLKYMREERNAFTPREIDGIRILEGSTGGGCTITSRELYERVGGFPEHKKLAYWHLAQVYQRAIGSVGYRSAFLVDLELWHAGGAHYAEPPREKYQWHEHAAKVKARKDRVKRLILWVPFAVALNERFRWFDPPEPAYVPRGVADQVAKAAEDPVRERDGAEAAEG
jgi:GT2 family glycosyltransferase